MSFESVNNPCPCESGLEYPYCCGASDRNELNLLAKISDDGVIDGDIPEGLIQAIRTINQTPDLYPVKLNLIQDYVQFVKMSAYWYSESVFLDPNRILGTCSIEASAQWLLKETEEIPSQNSPIIFHTAFCGSTLMINALAAIYHCLPVREPEALSNLLVYMRSQCAEPQKALWFNRTFNILSRRYEEMQVPVIKANDYGNGLIRDVLIRLPERPILFMYTPLADFFASCIKVESRKLWVRDRYQAVIGMASEQLTELASVNIDPNAIGEIIAVYWSYNIALYHSALVNHSDKIKSLNFNDMLEDPLAAVVACAQRFKLEQQKSIKPDDEMKWLLGIYSKDAAYEYSPLKRRDDLQKILNENVQEMAVAEVMARRLLGDKYSEAGLPNKLI